MLSSAAGLAGAAALGSLPAAPARAGTAPLLALGELENLVYGFPREAAPVPLTLVRRNVASARADFAAARYDRLAAALPSLLSTAAATRAHADVDHAAAAAAVLADAYGVASALAVKRNDDQLAWSTADRAFQAAEQSGDPLTIADARRALATVLRRRGRREAARDLLVRAAGEIEPGPHASREQLQMYAMLMQVAAFTAAVDQNRSDANSFLVEATEAARRLGRDDAYGHLMTGPSSVRLYQVSVAQVLGDNGEAIRHARTLRLADVPTAERKGRLLIDVARAYHQWGHPEPCFRALRRAEQVAPAEVRWRPPVHRMTVWLLGADRRGALPGLRAFAQRVGVPA
ncbi:hypothetical protein D5H75_32995 [Bailinhaonella thermotolerans]|uniref:Uncharacterized protein n=1 Tax=Bailinhaonella thermotolerans TaxID=1070861 RepID=A0A3A4APJ5_9ACTN|nr:hypothetical protein D5H75_32995 [Bailinhaonella thermotolerans]